MPRWSASGLAGDSLRTLTPYEGFGALGHVDGVFPVSGHAAVVVRGEIAAVFLADLGKIGKYSRRILVVLEKIGKFFPDFLPFSEDRHGGRHKTAQVLHPYAGGRGI